MNILSDSDTQNIFNELLLKSLSTDDVDDNETPKCLISNEMLEDDHIKLMCNHKFNYKPIMNEIRNQKHYSGYETQKLGTWQIKCPYCRNVQTGILPYKNNYPKIRFVNWPWQHAYITETCSAIMKSGKRKNQECGKKCFGKICTYHETINKKKIAAKSAKTKFIKTDSCQAIIKSGKRKGQICGCNLRTVENKQNKRCGKHLNK